MATLEQLCVLLTRPKGQTAELIAGIKAAGGRAVSMPMLEIDPILPGEGDAQAALGRKIMALDNYQILIFVSSNAARIGLEWIDQYWPQFPLGVDVVAIGPSTATALRERLPVTVIESETGMTSEAVLALELLAELQGKRVAIFRGHGGRELLAQTLLDRGAEVDYIEVYERQPVRYPPGQLADYCQQEGVNVASVLSVETLHNLLANLDIAESQQLKRLPLVTPSARVAEAATAEGFTWVVDCHGADTAATVAGLQAVADKLR